jgi:hypothetical protein
LLSETEMELSGLMVTFVWPPMPLVT